MSSLTAWVITGIVMMNMINNTSMTSINGVVLMSHIAPSSLLLGPLIAMEVFPDSGEGHCAEERMPRSGSVMNPTLTMPPRWTALRTRPTSS